MSTDEKDAATGKLVRECQTAKSDVARLKGEVDRIGQQFSQIGQALLSDPERVSIGRQALPAKYGRTHDFEEWSSPENVRALLDDFRNTTSELERLRRLLRDQGIDL